MTGVRFLRAMGCLVAVATGTLLGGCSAGQKNADVVNGKKQFIAKCAACHTLKRAGTTGVVGPNLDDAFDRAAHEGFGRSTFRGVVHDQILHPNRLPQFDPQTHQVGAVMPANLVHGRDVSDVAAYVAQAVAAPGQDSGLLAEVGAKKATGTAKEQAGKLVIPTDPSGALSYQFAAAVANAGSITIESPNKSAIDHDIAIEGPGINKNGATVKNGGVSQFTVNLKPGVYTYYCTLPGHRAGGMYGKLTVK